MRAPTAHANIVVMNICESFWMGQMYPLDCMNLGILNIIEFSRKLLFKKKIKKKQSNQKKLDTKKFSMKIDDFLQNCQISN